MPWIYRPRFHKTQHHGISREIPLGPKAVSGRWTRLGVGLLLKSLNRLERVDPGFQPHNVLVVDLTNEDLDCAALLESLSAGQDLAGIRTLAFYSHVDVRTRERAEQAGFDAVVPRSRMPREGPQLIERLAATA